MTVEAARTTAAVFISCRLDYCSSLLYGLPGTLSRKLQSVQNATARLITGTRRSDHISSVLRDFIGYPSESASQSDVWFACRLSTWPTTAVSCPTALGALCCQLTFRLAWCRRHSAVMAIELLQLRRDLACGTRFQSSCVILTSSMDCSDDS